MSLCKQSSRSLILLVVVSACDNAPLGSTRAAIIGGTATQGDPGVVLLRGTTATGFAVCSGALIAPDQVLTAAHCLAPASVGSVSSFDVFLGYDLALQGSDATQWIHVKDTAFDPLFDGQKLTAGHDVGVATLAAKTTVTPLALNREPLTPASLGQPLRVLGFGIAAGNDSAGKTLGIKRELATSLAAYSQQLLSFGISGANTCEGDSGGPALMTVGASAVIVGITSFGPADCEGNTTDTRADTVAAAFVAHWSDAAPDVVDAGASGMTTTVAPITGGGDVQPLRSGCQLAGAGHDDASLAWLLLLLLLPATRRRRALRR